jgi:dTDP-4-dehydrorhamnose 3,5-epimerase-like enzyme
MGLKDIRWIDLPTIHSNEGMVTFAQRDMPLPFEPRRIYFLHHVPQGATRGFHAHKRLQQVIFAASGSFRMVLDDGGERKEFLLDDLTRGIYVPRMIWRELHSFTPGAVCMVLASEPYDEADYIRDYDTFLGAVKVEA